jgi:hypothetical protein
MAVTTASHSPATLEIRLDGLGPPGDGDLDSGIRHDVLLPGSIRPC